MKPVHDIFFWDSLTFKIQKKCVMDIRYVLDIIFKKCKTWTLKLCYKAPNHRFLFLILFSNFEVVVHETCAWYIFLDSLTFKIWKKYVTDISNVLDIILKKCRTWTLKLCCKDPNHSSFNFVLLFWGGCPWNWCMIYFFWDSLMFKLWIKGVTNISNVLDII